MPACGKSTLGSALAQAGYVYIDLDEAVERRLGSTISEYVAAQGMEAFRHHERAELLRLSAPGAIVGCGGGTPCYGDNLERMLAQGAVVRLDCSRPRLIRRLIEGGTKRPMLREVVLTEVGVGDFVDRLAAQRAPYYDRAPHSFDSTYLETPDEIAATVQRFIELLARIAPAVKAAAVR